MTLRFTETLFYLSLINNVARVMPNPLTHAYSDVSNDVSVNATLTKVDVNLVVFAPDNSAYDFSMLRILPAVEIALETVTRRGICRNVKFDVTPIDSKYGQDGKDVAVEIEAYKRIANPTKSTHAIFGPVYDVTLEKIARISAFCDMAVFSPGGFSVNFGLEKTSKSRYRTLVRVGPSINFIFNMMRWLLVDHFGYRRIKTIADKHNPLHGDICKWLHGGFDYLFNHYKNEYVDRPFDFDNYLLPKKFDAEEILRTEVGNEFAGKTNSACYCTFGKYSR